MGDAVLGLIGVLVGAVLAWGSAVLLQLRSERGERMRLLAVLFGELLNLQDHYSLASAELPDSLHGDRAAVQLKMSRYGGMSIVDGDLARLAFLYDSEIRDLMQLSLVVRNTDILVEQAAAFAADASKADSAPPVHRDAVERRMVRVSRLARSIMDSIAGRSDRLKQLLVR